MQPPPVAESLGGAPPAEWYLHEQTTRLEVDLEREELRGTVELRVRLPTAPALSWLRLNSAAQCEIESATLDGAPLEWEYAAAYVPEDGVSDALAGVLGGIHKQVMGNASSFDLKSAVTLRANMSAITPEVLADVSVVVMSEASQGIR